MMPKDYKSYDENECWNIGKRIQEVREKRHIKAVDVAVCLNIESNQYSRIENGRANCTIKHMFVLAQVLDCSVDYLLFGKTPTLTSQQQNSINELLLAFGEEQRF